jgi:hypothetical protein
MNAEVSTGEKQVPGGSPESRHENKPGSCCRREPRNNLNSPFCEHHDCREDQVEVFFHREGPEVVGIDLVRWVPAKRAPEIANHQNRGSGGGQTHRQPVQESEHQINGQEKPRRWENPKKSPHIEISQGDASIHAFFFQQPGTDEQPANGEEEIDARPPVRPQVSRADAARTELVRVMSKDDGGNRDCAPAIQAGQVAASGRTHLPRRHWSRNGQKLQFCSLGSGTSNNTRAWPHRIDAASSR